MTFKIERKPNYWQVNLTSGEYSDREDWDHVVAADGPDQAWEFLKEYFLESKDASFHAIVRGEERYENPLWPEGKHAWSEDTWYVRSVEMLPVIYLETL